MKRKFFLVFFVLALLSACASEAPAVSRNGIEIYNPRVMAGKAGEVTGGFMSIENTRSEADKLLGAACGAAAMTQAHETTMDDGVMRMREVEVIEIPAGGRVELKQGGYHIMLMDLKQDVIAGETAECTLTFERAGEVALSLMVMSR